MILTVFLSSSIHEANNLWMFLRINIFSSWISIFSRSKRRRSSSYQTPAKTGRAGATKKEVATPKERPTNQSKIRRKATEEGAPGLSPSGKVVARRSTTDILLLLLPLLVVWVSFSFSSHLGQEQDIAVLLQLEGGVLCANLLRRWPPGSGSTDHCSWLRVICGVKSRVNALIVPPSFLRSWPGRGITSELPSSGDQGHAQKQDLNQAPADRAIEETRTATSTTREGNTSPSNSGARKELLHLSRDQNDASSDQHALNNTCPRQFQRTPKVPEPAREAVIAIAANSLSRVAASQA